ncbi:MAG: hypothetical protein WCK33_09560 [Phycisphaerae bacterium]
MPAFAATILTPFTRFAISAGTTSVIASTLGTVAHRSRLATAIAASVARPTIAAGAGFAIGMAVASFRATAVGSAIRRRFGPAVARRLVRAGRLPLSRRRRRILSRNRLRMAGAGGADDRDQTHAHELLK